MASSYEMLDVRVTEVEQMTPLIKRFVLERIDGQALPPFSGGSHVIVQMDGGRFSNAYSLLGEPADTRRYQIAVRLEEASRGGSAYMHREVGVGSTLRLSTPNNLFALDPAAGRHVLVAGGIGITPFLAQIHQLRANGGIYELHYAFRSPEHGAFQAELADEVQAGRARLYIDSLEQRLDMEALLQGLAADAHVYICGPRPMIDALIATAERLGIDPARVHWEQFGAAPASGGAFTLVLARSGRELQVEEGVSILQVLEKTNAARVECLCREGVCGTCETRILEGEVDHRDQYLSAQEKAAQQTLMVCVSRARSTRLVLDL